MLEGSAWTDALIGALTTVLGAGAVKFFFRIRLDARKDRLDTRETAAQLGTVDNLVKENARLSSALALLDVRLNSVLARAWQAEDQVARLKLLLRQHGVALPEDLQ